MRLATFRLRAGGTPRTALLAQDGKLIDLGSVKPQAPFDTTDMVALIGAGDAALTWLRDVAAKAPGTLSQDDVVLLAPIPRPRKNVFCVGWNYLEHFDEAQKIRAQKVDLPEHPVFFSKTPTAVIGPHDDIHHDTNVTKMLDWEIELGVIIGKSGKNIAESDAMGHVFGYTVVNDVSARNLQRQHGGQWFKGKSIDGTCPIGPWIVTADEISPDELQLTCRVNGVVKQSANTRNMYFRLPRLICELSLGLTLESGDIISTGTPQGVGSGRTPPEFMHAGDILESEIAGIGAMRNKIVS